jgi:hypothetical protein
MKSDRIVRIFDIGIFNDHHCFNYLFITALSDCVVLHSGVQHSVLLCSKTV